jgi:hypothetical protein
MMEDGLDGSGKESTLHVIHSRSLATNITN